MKKFLLVVFVLLCFGKIKAQDTITKLNGETIIVKIIEITSSEIKYKRIDSPDGPTYIEFKSKVKMIRFSSGLVEKYGTAENSAANETPYSNHIFKVGTKYSYHNVLIIEKEMWHMLLKNENEKVVKLIKSAKSAHRRQYIGFGAIPMGILAIIFMALAENSIPQDYYGTGTTTVTAEQQSAYNTYLALSMVSVGGMLACPAITVVSKIQRAKYNRAAIKLYNEGQQ